MNLVRRQKCETASSNDLQDFIAKYFYKTRRPDGEYE